MSMDGWWMYTSEEFEEARMTSEANNVVFVKIQLKNDVIIRISILD